MQRSLPPFAEQLAAALGEPIPCFVSAFHGRLGDRVYKTYRRPRGQVRLVVTRVADFTGYIPTAAQRTQRDRMRAATAYAQRVYADPAAKAVYAAAAQKLGRAPFRLAISLHLAGRVLVPEAALVSPQITPRTQIRPSVPSTPPVPIGRAAAPRRPPSNGLRWRPERERLGEPCRPAAVSVTIPRWGGCPKGGRGDPADPPRGPAGRRTPRRTTTHRGRFALPLPRGRPPVGIRHGKPSLRLACDGPPVELGADIKRLRPSFTRPTRALIFKPSRALIGVVEPHVKRSAQLRCLG